MRESVFRALANVEPDNHPLPAVSQTFVRPRRPIELLRLRSGLRPLEAVDKKWRRTNVGANLLSLSALAVRHFTARLTNRNRLLSATAANKKPRWFPNGAF